MKIRLISALAASMALGFSGLVFAQTTLETDAQKLGYTLGFQVGQNTRIQGIDQEIDHEAFIAAIRDVLAGNDLQMTEQDMQASIAAFQQKRQAEIQQLANENQVASDAFLAGNKGKEGIITTASGLQYRVDNAGDGAAPSPASTVRVHYAGRLIDGREFDSSYARNEPAEFPLNGVIQGWQEGLLLMKEGAKFEFFVPPSLAYGANAPGEIGPNQVLIFTVELLEVK